MSSPAHLPPIPMREGSSPRVSLVLPVHNGEQFLGSAIASIRAQTFVDFELICVDDASTDGSPHILATAAAVDSRIHVIRLEQNVGLPAALNRGFAAARGAYFSWTSDDNLLRPHMLMTLVAALDAHVDAAIAHSDYAVIGLNSDLINVVETNARGGLLMGNHVGASFLYHRDVDFALGGYDASLFGAEDYDFWLRASAHFRFVHVAEDLYQYRKHPRSLTNSRAEAIQTLTTKVVLRAIPSTLNRSDRAAALLGLFHRNFIRLRLDLVRRAFVAAPLKTARRLPDIGWHALRVLRARWFA